jgi:hypothetical protein
MNVNLNRQVFDKKKFNETVDTSFTQLVSQPDPTFFDLNLATVEDFFTLYNKFFFQIPKEGEVNSHTYLIKESSDYVGLQANSEDIQALLDEIASLRQENLATRQELLDVINQVPTQQLIRDNQNVRTLPILNI